MKKYIIFGLLSILLIGVLFYFQSESTMDVENIKNPKGEVFESNIPKITSTHNSQIVVDLNKKNDSDLNVSQDFLESLEAMMSERGSKEFDDFFTIDTFDDTGKEIIGTYKVGMLEEVFMGDKVNIPFFDTYQVIINDKSIDPSGYMTISADLEGDEEGYLGFVENKNEKVLNGVLYDYEKQTEYHIEGENGKFKIYPILSNGYTCGGTLL